MQVLINWLPLATGLVGIGLGVLLGRATKKLKVTHMTVLQKPPAEHANGMSKRVREILS